MAGSRGRGTFVNTAAIARVSGLLRRRLRGAREASTLSVTVGVHEEEGSQREPNGATVASVAAFHEFGTSRVPRRSWLLDGIAENESAIEAAIKRLGRAIVQNRIEPDQGYLMLGELIVSRLLARIRSGIAPPLAASTIDRKGSSTPLIDEGRLLASIRAKLRER